MAVDRKKPEPEAASVTGDVTDAAKAADGQAPQGVAAARAETQEDLQAKTAAAVTPSPRDSKSKAGHYICRP